MFFFTEVMEVRKKYRKKLRDEDGQAMVEFALVLPIFLLIVCGIIDFGWLFYNQLAVNNICREGARYAVVSTQENRSTEPIVRHIRNTVNSTYTMNDVDINVYYTVPTDPLNGDVVVEVKTDFSFITPLLSPFLGDSRVLDSRVVMKVES